MALSALKKPIGIKKAKMAKIIFTSRYIRNASRAGNLVKYMGTREGVEKLPYGVDHSPATKKQDDLIASIVKKYPTATDYPEYVEYQQKNIDYLSPILAGVIRDEVESVEKNVCEMLFRLAVEQAKLCHAVAANSHFSEESMQRLHKECVHDVSNCNGIITFEEAYRYQKS